MNNKFDIKIAKEADLVFTDEIESEALPSLEPYYKNNFDIFEIEIPGELLMVYHGDYPVAMGRYSIHPDHTMWLETLRVRPDYQRMGIGQMLYNEFFKITGGNGISLIRMYTEDFNTKSQNLASKMGFSRHSTYRYYISQDNSTRGSLDLDPCKDIDFVMRTLKENPWPNLLCINNVFYQANIDNIGWMVESGMVFEISGEIIILGARHNKDSHLYIAYMSKPCDDLIKFAQSKATGKTLALATSLDFDNGLLEDFDRSYDLLVYEKHL